jgi:hypothetical protein
MNFTDFRKKLEEASLLNVNNQTDPMFLRKLLRGAKASVNDKQMPISISRVLKGIDIFNRTGRTQSIPKNVAPHYDAYLQRQRALSSKFANRSSQVEEIELEDNVIQENESRVIQKSVDPPPVILLKRKGIRIFPDGRRVAVYTNSKLGLVFSVPYEAYQEYRPGATFNSGSVPGVQVK